MPDDRRKPVLVAKVRADILNRFGDFGGRVRLAGLQGVALHASPNGMEVLANAIGLVLRDAIHIYLSDLGTRAELHMEDQIDDLVRVIPLYFGLHLRREIPLNLQELLQGTLSLRQQIVEIR